MTSLKSLESKEKALFQLNSQVNEKTKALQSDFHSKIQEILKPDDDLDPSAPQDFESSDFLEKYQEKMFTVNVKASHPDLISQISKAKATENIAYLQEIQELKEKNDEKEDFIDNRKEEIGVLEEELTIIMKKIREKEGLIDKMNEKGKGISEESKRFVKEITSLNEKIEILHRENDDLSNKLEGYKTDIAKNFERKKQLEKENDGFLDDLAKKEEKIKLMERTLEENKTKIKQKKSIEIEEKEVFSKENEKLKAEQKKLIRQKGELLTGFKKMKKIIEILKKQKLHLETAMGLGFTEEEYIKALDLPEKLLG